MGLARYIRDAIINLLRLGLNFDRESVSFDIVIKVKTQNVKGKIAIQN